jgi:hypothetical protein
MLRIGDIGEFFSGSGEGGRIGANREQGEGGFEDDEGEGGEVVRGRGSGETLCIGLRRSGWTLTCCVVYWTIGGGVR